jgi:hypothetical protein
MKYTEKYGQPQGNELVYGKDIIRRTDTFEFNLIERFKSSRAAHFAYKEWMKENEWNYVKPIVGWDNGPVTIDSWGNK